ncbi:g10176 [Coccomyxa viridis]|uniref:G10176 protein n=1 Tax=Coccomyxa viridis TaxID=1274662 RepID=A0ABP1G542_9CHLO
MTGSGDTMHDIKKNIPGTDAHAMHNPTRGTGDDGVKNAVKDHTPGTDRNRHNQQSMTENVKEVLPGTKEHEGANEGLGHKIAKMIPGTDANKEHHNKI